MRRSDTGHAHLPCLAGQTRSKGENIKSKIKIKISRHLARITCLEGQLKWKRKKIKTKLKTLATSDAHLPCLASQDKREKKN
jgi:hypothetical protein